jgi:hypothetical protein
VNFVKMDKPPGIKKYSKKSDRAGGVGTAARRGRDKGKAEIGSALGGGPLLSLGVN